MPILNRADEATRNSIYAVFLCFLGSGIGIGAGYAIAVFSSRGHLPVSTFLLSLFIALAGMSVIRYRRASYDPSATFVAYLMSLSASGWILNFFFAAPELGPFAEQSLSVPTALTNATFGIVLFILIGATVGITYHAARRSYGPLTGQRVLCAAVGVGLPIYMLMKTEYFLTHFQF